MSQGEGNSWNSTSLIRLLVDLSGLLHDLGKANEAFQSRLTRCDTRCDTKSLIRHEWVSLRLFEAFVGSGEGGDQAWLARLAEPSAQDDASWIDRLHRDCPGKHVNSPFKSLAGAPIAQAVAWLVVTHHRLPQLPAGTEFQISMLRDILSQVQPAWNEPAFDFGDEVSLKPYWRFPQGLPVTNPAWKARASRVARHLLLLSSNSLKDEDLLGNPFLMHISRLALMLADHHYSGLETSPRDLMERLEVKPSNDLLANTRRSDGKPNQPLDEHLVGVAHHGDAIACGLPRFARFLPGVQSSRLLQGSRNQAGDRYRWQDQATEMAQGIRTRSERQGAFIVNMSSTGCGKTLGNARIMYALADPDVGMRCAFAVGLRSLTLQTGRAFRSNLQLRKDEMAVLVGGCASRALFEHHEKLAEATGSASLQKLVEEDAHVIYEASIDDHPLLRRAISDPQLRKLLIAPVLVCTIDHLTPATESERGGRQIAPTLRLMSGDLVIDEPDDFDMADLPALTRLVHWAGLLGSRVLLSSATLAPALVQGLFEAYRSGRQHFNANMDWPAGEIQTHICCAWVDEFHQQEQDCADAKAFETMHDVFVKRRHFDLTAVSREPRRIAELIPFKTSASDIESLASDFASQSIEAALRLHNDYHSIDPATGKRVSFGLVRMANVEPLFEVALALFRQSIPHGVRIHLCVYHARHPMLVRSEIERTLSRALDRHEPDAVFDEPHVRNRLDAQPESDHLFIVLGSPVTENGQDHDYDWAVLEPSSLRSLIQAIGRVARHRYKTVDRANVLVFNRNLRSRSSPGQPAFCMPGFETKADAYRLSTHDLNRLISAEDLAALDARPRIVCPPAASLRPRDRLADLEHARLRGEMLVQSSKQVGRGVGSRARAEAGAGCATLNATTWWSEPPQDALLSAVLQREQPFRKESSPPDDVLVLLPSDDSEDARAVIHRVLDAEGGRSLYESNDLRCLRLDEALVKGDRIEHWAFTDYMESLKALSKDMGMSLTDCAQRFSTVRVRPHDNGWRYHPVLGFSSRR